MTAIDSYLSEPVLIGGLPTTRGDFIREEREKGTSDELIYRYLQGFDLMQSRN